MTNLYRMFLCVGILMNGSGHAAQLTLSGAASGSQFDVVYDDALTGLFGRPFLSNNFVYFTPTSFAANALGSNASQIRSSSVLLRLVAHNGFGFTQFALSGRGDFYLEGAASTVDVTGSLTVTNALGGFAPVVSSIAAVTADGPTPGTVLASIGPSSAYRNLPNTSNWTSSASILATAANGLAQAGEVDFSISNTLTASNGPANGSFAESFIESKFVGGSGLVVSVTPIPEPSEWLMCIFGIAVIGALARRNSATRLLTAV
jgi:hypothetical protein